VKQHSPLSAEEQEKAKILFASGKTIHAVAQSLGRSPHTLKKFLQKPEIVKEVGIQREELATMFDSITDRTLRGVTDEDITKSSLLQKMTAAGISVDKSLLLRNQATSIVDVRVLLDVAAMIRRESENDDLQVQAQRIITLPVPQPELPERTEQPAPAQTQSHPTPTTPPAVKVRYYSSNPIGEDSSEYNPLTHGLFPGKNL
jgi:hypothetical protein